MSKNPTRSAHAILTTAAAICLAATLAIVTTALERSADPAVPRAFEAVLTSR